MFFFSRIKVWNQSEFTFVSLEASGISHARAFFIIFINVLSNFCSLKGATNITRNVCTIIV